MSRPLAPISSPTAIAAGTTKADGCTTDSTCVSSKSSACVSVPFASAAHGAGAPKSYPITLASRAPAHERVISITGAPAPSAEAASATPTESSMCRRAAAITSGGRSSNRKPATNSAICWDAVPMDECYPVTRICSPRLGERIRVRIGIAIGGPLDRIGAVARRCEEAGFDSLWIAEAGRTAFVQAAVAAQATKTIRIGTSIALAFPRSPVITAMAARDLAELSNGRFTLGLGTQVKRVNEFRYSTTFEHPAPKMSELIDVCREVWASFGGAPIDHRGRFFTVTMQPFPGAGPPPGPIPIYLAAVNERMLQLIGAKADGFLGHPFTSPSYVQEVALKHIAAGAEAAGRSIKDIEIA